MKEELEKLTYTDIR